MTTSTRERIAILAAAMRAYDRAHAEVVCSVCGASWDREEGTDCRWCTEALGRLRDNERKALLWPDWLHIVRHPGYLACSDVDRKIWAQTRGVANVEGAASFWAEHLRRGVEAGLITRHEAEGALRRAGKVVEAAA